MGRVTILFLIAVTSQTTCVTHAFDVTDLSPSITKQNKRRYEGMCLSTAIDDLNSYGVSSSSSSSNVSTLSEPSESHVNVGGEILSRVQNLAQFAQTKPSFTSDIERDTQTSQKNTVMGTGDTALLFSSTSSYNGLQEGRYGSGQNRDLVLSTLETLERDSKFLCLIQKVPD